MQGMPWKSWISIKLLQHEQLYISNQQPCFIRHSARRSGGLEREKRAKNPGCWKTFGLYGVEGMSKCGSLKYRLRNNHFILYIPCLFYAISMPTQLESARHSQSRKLKEICDRLPVPDLCFLDITWLLCHHCFPLQLAQVSLGWAKRRTVAATMATDTVEPQKTGATFLPSTPSPVIKMF
jgi:hypothetical protein